MNSRVLNHFFKKLLLIVYVLSFSIPLYASQLRLVDMQNEWGIEPVHLRVTADGYMVEFRYKVIDPEKARILTDRKDFPHLQSLKSKAKLTVPYFPTVGFVKSSRRFLKKDKNYTVMFSNEGRHLIRGDKVKIEIKDQVSPVLTLK